MSRAFVKESDGTGGEADLPDRPQSEHPNYVTPAGFASLQRQHQALAREREALAGAEDLDSRATMKTIERDLRYLQGRIERAIVVDPRAQPHADIRFGATVTLVDGEARESRFTIVGEDETCAARGLISWVSPLARAMLGRRRGDTVVWDAPAGVREYEVADFDYREP